MFVMREGCPRLIRCAIQVLLAVVSLRNEIAILTFHSALSGRTESRIIDFLTLDLLRDQRLPLNRLQLFAVIAATNHAVDVSREIDALFAWHDVRASSKVRGAMLNSISTFDLFFVFKKYEMPAAALCCCLVVQHNFRIERPPQGRG